MTGAPTILVAGATGNVGRATSVALADRGAGVVLAGRRPDALEEAAQAIRQGRGDTPGAGSDAISTLVIDFGDLDSVDRAAAEVLDRCPTLDGLVLSVVALIQGGPTILANGHEIMFATNVLGPFRFTQLLMDRLASSDAMVVHVVAPFTRHVDWDDLESIRDHRTGVAYDRTKTMNRIIAAELARRHGDEVTSVAYHPGFVIDKDDAHLAEKWPSGFSGHFWRIMTTLVAKDPATAGEPLAELLTSTSDRSAMNGAYVKRSRPRRPDKAMRDEATGARLWDELVRLTDVADG